MPKIISAVCDALPDLIAGISSGIIDNIPAIIQAGITLFTSIISDLPTIISQITANVPRIIDGIVGAFGELAGRMFDIGKDAASSLGEGLLNVGTFGLYDQVKKDNEKLAADLDGFVERLKAEQSGAGVFTGSGFNNFKSALRDTSSSVKATAADTTRSGGAYGPKIENDVSSSVNINMYVDGQKTSSTQYSRLKDGETVGCYINNGKGR